MKMKLCFDFNEFFALVTQSLEAFFLNCSNPNFFFVILTYVLNSTKAKLKQ